LQIDFKLIKSSKEGNPVDFIGFYNFVDGEFMLDFVYDVEIAILSAKLFCSRSRKEFQLREGKTNLKDRHPRDNELSLAVGFTVKGSEDVINSKFSAEVKKSRSFLAQSIFIHVFLDSLLPKGDSTRLQASRSLRSNCSINSARPQRRFAVRQVEEGHLLRGSFCLWRIQASLVGQRHHRKQLHYNNLPARRVNHVQPLA